MLYSAINVENIMDNQYAGLKNYFNNFIEIIQDTVLQFLEGIEYQVLPDIDNHHELEL
ncbi:44878_t:CDS:2 [Gigaspora margarita]|uniref:44878_t:CDS:1 n=1 Tax=Gigaspora margarita TaxID=4874 RepID=A0ABN7UFH6_GIGMA|nr:44878_t:CDS:2 [Gigaspora margarita]